VVPPLRLEERQKWPKVGKEALLVGRAVVRLRNYMERGAIHIAKKLTSAAEMFAQVDADRDGRITPIETRQVIHLVTPELSPNQIDQLCQLMDALHFPLDNQNRRTFPELQAAFKRLPVEEFMSLAASTRAPAPSDHGGLGDSSSDWESDLDTPRLGSPTRF
jgi:hypothetical protein